MQIEEETIPQQTDLATKLTEKNTTQKTTFDRRDVKSIDLSFVSKVVIITTSPG